MQSVSHPSLLLSHVGKPHLQPPRSGQRSVAYSPIRCSDPLNPPTLHGRISELEDGTVVPPGALLPWLDRADLERAVFAPGRRVEISPTVRLFSGATRRAIEVRDRGCTHPTCDVAPPRCQVDHVQPFALGGPTTQENGRLLCGYHNRLRHDQNQRPPPRE
jgi:hypothetical protein